MFESRRGFTLLELVIVVAIVGILAAAALPLARWSVKRSKEHELQQALRVIRIALDRYHDAAAAGLIAVPDGASGYPPSLEVLVEGVPLVQEMPSPVPAAAGEYAATGAGLTGGLQALMQAQEAAGGAGGGPAGAVGGVGGELGGGTLTLTPEGSTWRPSGTGRGGLGTAGPGARRPPAGGLAGQSTRAESPFADRPSPFGGGATGDALDAEGEAAEPLLGPDGQPLLLKFLRVLPVDPMTGEADWGLRCYGEPPEDRLWCGTDVFDVYSKSVARAIDGTPYKDW